MIVVSHDITMATPFFSRVALVNRTLTLAPEGRPDTTLMRTFIGPHAPDCPVEQIIRHNAGCGCPPAGPERRP